MGILVIIGFICILYFVSKFLTKMGEGLSRLSSEISDYVATTHKRAADEDRIRERYRKASEQARSNIKGVDDAIYNQRIAAEIEELTK